MDDKNEEKEGETFTTYTQQWCCFATGRNGRTDATGRACVLMVSGLVASEGVLGCAVFGREGRTWSGGMRCVVNHCRRRCSNEGAWFCYWTWEAWGLSEIPLFVLLLSRGRLGVLLLPDIEAPFLLSNASFI